MKTGFNAAEIFRKYLWYLLRERKFDTEAVSDVVQLKNSLQLSDGEVRYTPCWFYQCLLAYNMFARKTDIMRSSNSALLGACINTKQHLFMGYPEGLPNHQAKL